MIGLLLVAAMACGDADARQEARETAGRTDARVEQGPADGSVAPGAENGQVAPGAADGSVAPGGHAADIEVGHTLGPDHAPIAVVEFSDFGCPYCARFARSTFPELRREYVETGRARWRYVPVVFGFAGGELMAAAAECAAAQGGDEAFWQVHDLFYQRQTALRGQDARPRLLDWLADLDLDRGELDDCMDDPGTSATLDRHNEAARQWYVRGTPTFVVNGVPMSGAAPTDFFRRVFDTVLDPSGL
jgi:protein-disulfide isomerase